MSDRTLYEINGEIPSDVWTDLRRRVGDGSLVPVESAYEVTYCPVHDVTWPVNHERCGLIVLAHYTEVDG